MRTVSAPGNPALATVRSDGPPLTLRKASRSAARVGDDVITPTLPADSFATLVIPPA
jgi:hypothetical protein